LGFVDQLAVMLAHVTRVDRTADFYPAQHGPYVLRNLTTRQFVRAEALTRRYASASGHDEAHDEQCGPFLEGIGFGDVVAAHILWQDGLWMLPKALQGVPGVECWAGHCFDIVTLEHHARHEERAGGLPAWRDISEKIGSEMDRLWRWQRG
jgi:hypothetical protein